MIAKKCIGFGLATLVMVSGGSGCIDLSGLFPGSGTGGTPSGGPASFTASLSATNPTPQIRDGIVEQVFLSCVVTNAGTGRVEFRFEPVDSRLIVNADSGTAIFTSDPSDVGASFQFVCIATNASGEEATSNTVTLTPTM